MPILSLVICAERNRKTTSGFGEHILSKVSCYCAPVRLTAYETVSGTGRLDSNPTTTLRKICQKSFPVLCFGFVPLIQSKDRWPTTLNVF